MQSNRDFLLEKLASTWMRSTKPISISLHKLKRVLHYQVDGLKERIKDLLKVPPKESKITFNDAAGSQDSAKLTRDEKNKTAIGHEQNQKKMFQMVSPAQQQTNF